MLDLGITNVKRLVRYWRVDFGKGIPCGVEGARVWIESGRIYFNPIDGRPSRNVRLNGWWPRAAALNRRYEQRGRDPAEERKEV